MVYLFNDEIRYFSISAIAFCCNVYWFPSDCPKIQIGSQSCQHCESDGNRDTLLPISKGKMRVVPS